MAFALAVMLSESDWMEKGDLLGWVCVSDTRKLLVIHDSGVYRQPQGLASAVYSWV